MSMRLLLCIVLLACVSGCARERVEVGDSQDDAIDAATDAGTALFPPPADAGSTCGPAPIVKRCERCPNGYVIFQDGGTNCECCL
jgi:hypothetical protein